MRDEHVRLRWLADRRDGRLAGRRREAVEAHLATGCASCTRTEARLDRALVALREGPLAPAPATLVRSARRLFAAQRWARVLAAPAELLARLVFDQRVQVVPALRSAVGEARRMLWAVGDHELDLAIAEGPGGTELEGPFLPAEDDGTSSVAGDVTAWRDGRAVASSRLDAEGRFRLADLPGGVYALLGTVGGKTFRAMPLVLGEGATGEGSGG